MAEMVELASSGFLVCIIFDRISASHSLREVQRETYVPRAIPSKPTTLLYWMLPVRDLLVFPCPNMLRPDYSRALLQDTKHNEACNGGYIDLCRATSAPLYLTFVIGYLTRIFF